MRKIPCFVVVSQLLTMALGSAHAQPTAPASAEGDQGAAQRRARAAELRSLGDAAGDKRRLDEAIAAWGESWALERNAGVACNIGNAEILEKRYAQATLWLTRCVQGRKDQVGPERMDRREREVARRAFARAQVEEITVETTAGASVFLDGAHVGKAPLEEPLFVEPGAHRIEVRLGDRTAIAEVNAMAGGTRRVELKPPPDAPIEPPRAAPMKAAPPAALPPPRTERTVLWSPLVAGGAATALTLGLGITFRVMSSTAGHEATSTMDRIVREQGGAAVGCATLAAHPACPTFEDLDATRSRLANASNAMFVAFGVVGAATLAFGAYEYHRVTVAPSIGGIAGRVVW